MVTSPNADYTKYYINFNMLTGVEAGIELRFLNSMEDTGYGYLDNPTIGYKDCIRINFIQAIHASDHLSYIIQVKNVIILLSVHLLLSGLILTVLIGHWFYRFFATIVSKCLSR